MMCLHPALLSRKDLTFSLVTTDALRRPERAGEDGYVGLDLVKTINQEFPQLPVILVSLDSPEWLREQAPDLRVNGVIGKDLSDEKIGIALQQVLSGESLPNPWIEQAKHDGTFAHDGTIRYNGKQAQTSLGGFQFEEQVADIFRKAGAKVEQEKHFADKYFDLYVEWKPQDEKTQKLIVQVKTSDKPIDANTILSFAENVKLLREKGTIDRSIFVSDNGFTRKALTEAQKIGMYLFTVNELESAIEEGDFPTLRRDQVFISNAQTQNEFVKKLKTSLERAAIGFFHYKNKDAIPIGSKNWLDEIIKQIRNSGIFLVLLDSHYKDSRWCMAELQEAIDLWDKGKIRLHVYVLEDEVNLEELLFKRLSKMQSAYIQNKQDSEKIEDIVQDIVKLKNRFLLSDLARTLLDEITQNAQSTLKGLMIHSSPNGGFYVPYVQWHINEKIDDSLYPYHSLTEILKIKQAIEELVEKNLLLHYSGNLDSNAHYLLQESAESTANMMAPSLLEEMKNNTQAEPKGLTVFSINEYKTQGCHVAYLHNQIEKPPPTENIIPIRLAIKKLEKDGFIKFYDAEGQRERFVFLENRGATSSSELYSIHLRSEPLMVSIDDSEKTFGLDAQQRPLEYIENDLEDRGQIVVDHITSLMWQKSGSENSLTYKDALEYVEHLNRQKLAGYDDWRLPTIPELMSLLEAEKQEDDLYINLIFDKSQRWCWSCDQRSSESMWSISFNSGSVRWSVFRGILYVRAVR